MTDVKNKREREGGTSKSWVIAARNSFEDWLYELVVLEKAAENTGKASKLSAFVDMWSLAMSDFGPSKVQSMNGSGYVRVGTLEESPALVELRVPATGQHYEGYWESDTRTATARMVEHFGEWSTEQVKNTRRFLIVFDEISEREVRWRDKFRHLDVITAAEYLRRWAV